MSENKCDLKTLGEVWDVLRSHGIFSGYCSKCDQYKIATVLIEQDAKITGMLESMEAMRDTFFVCGETPLFTDAWRNHFHTKSVECLTAISKAKREVPR